MPGGQPLDFDADAGQKNQSLIQRRSRAGECSDGS
jgi:hypothetical protein